MGSRSSTESQPLLLDSQQNVAAQMFTSRRKGSRHEVSSPSIDLGLQLQTSSSMLSHQKHPWWWAPDAAHTVCSLCAKRFRWLFCRRHHCRKCGGVFCSTCCPEVLIASVVGGGENPHVLSSVATSPRSQSSTSRKRASSLSPTVYPSSSSTLNQQASRRSYSDMHRRPPRSSDPPSAVSKLSGATSPREPHPGENGRRMSTRLTTPVVTPSVSGLSPASSPTHRVSMVSIQHEEDPSQCVLSARPQPASSAPASPSTGYTRVCRRCRCPLLSLLSDELLTYIARFLKYDDQDKLLRTCTRWLLLVQLPFPFIEHLDERFHWIEPVDVLSLREDSIVLRVLDKLGDSSAAPTHSSSSDEARRERGSAGLAALLLDERRRGTLRCLKIVSKYHYFSRRMWRRFQQYVDVQYAAGAQLREFPYVYDVVQTRDTVCLVMELVPPERHVPLFKLIAASHRSSALKDQKHVKGEGVGEDELAASVLRLPLVMFNAAQAVQHLHEKLRVAHRSLTAYSICVNVGCHEHPAVSARDIPPPPVCDVTLFGLQGVRILGEGALSKDAPSYLRDRLQINRTVQQQVSGLPPAVAASVSVQTPTPPPRRRPPPLPIPIDLVLHRKAEMFRRAAEQRRAVLRSDADRRRAFTRAAEPTPIAVMTSSNGDLVSSFVVRSGILASASSPTTRNAGRGGDGSPRTASFCDGGAFASAQFEAVELHVADNGVMPVVTPRGCLGFAAPDVLSQQTAALRPVGLGGGVLASLAQTGLDVKSWDVYSFGVLLSLSLYAYWVAVDRELELTASCAAFGAQKRLIEHAGRLLALLADLSDAENAAGTDKGEVLFRLCRRSQRSHCNDTRAEAVAAAASNTHDMTVLLCVQLVEVVELVAAHAAAQTSSAESVVRTTAGSPDRAVARHVRESPMWYKGLLTWATLALRLLEPISALRSSVTFAFIADVLAQVERECSLDRHCRANDDTTQPLLSLRTTHDNPWPAKEAASVAPPPVGRGGGKQNVFAREA